MIAILQDVRSMYNVGSIFRTADAAGVEKIYLAGITPEPVDRFGQFRPQFVKVSLGAEKTVKWDASATVSAGQARSVRATLKLIEKLKGEGYKIFAVEQDKNSIPYYKVVFRRVRDKNKLALVFGNEVKGIPRAILKKCDKILEIPMRGKKESLNVSVAFGIIVFHLIHA